MLSNPLKYSQEPENASINYLFADKPTPISHLHDEYTSKISGEALLAIFSRIFMLKWAKFINFLAIDVLFEGNSIDLLVKKLKNAFSCCFSRDRSALKGLIAIIRLFMSIFMHLLTLNHIYPSNPIIQQSEVQELLQIYKPALFPSFISPTLNFLTSDSILQRKARFPAGEDAYSKLDRLLSTAEALSRNRSRSFRYARCLAL
jgi:hypothetical protein